MRIAAFIVMALVILIAFTLIIQSKEGYGTAVSLNEEFKLKVGGKVLIRGSGIALTFNRIIEDSRCPINVYCIWTGRVTVELYATTMTGEIASIFLTIPGAETKEFNGYITTLSRVEPVKEYPDKMEILQSEYETTLKVSER